jgi:hypothetical protein
MRRILFICSAVILLTAPAYAQKAKPWTEWSEKDAEKILNDSGWGQTQTEGGADSAQPTQTSTITSTTAAKERTAMSASGAATTAPSGEAKASPLSVHYRVRLMSAKPIRAAFVRMVELQGAPAEKMAALRTFVDREFADYIVVTITMDGTDRKRMGSVIQELTNGGEEALKTTTYLERKDGKRLALMAYRAPDPADGLGAKFVFPRMVDGKPFLDASSGEVRFGTELGKVVKIYRRFKVSEMMYDGKLEY